VTVSTSDTLTILTLTLTLNLKYDKQHKYDVYQRSPLARLGKQPLLVRAIEIV